MARQTKTRGIKEGERKEERCLCDDEALADFDLFKRARQAGEIDLL